MKKKILSGLLALCLVFGSAAALPQNAFVDNTGISASAEESGGFTYKILDDGTVEIYEYNGDETDIVIPSTIDGKTVTKLYDLLFGFNEAITSVTIPGTIKIIPFSAFYDCKNLTSVTIGDGVEQIGDSAFCECPKLKEVNIPSSVTSIGDSVFVKTQWLSDLRKTDPLVIVNSVLLDGKTCKGNVTIPDGISCIAGGAFGYNNDLTSVKIPDSVKLIGDYAFEYCPGLTSIDIPGSVKQIGLYAFFKCDNLKTVKLANGTEVIGQDAFGICKSLTSIEIPDSVTTIGRYAFDSENLASVTLPKSLKSLGIKAFNTTKWLSELRKKDPLVIVDGILIDAATCPDSSVTVPDTVRMIGGGAFYKSKTLTNVTIPESVTSIGEEAFLSCNKLESASILGSVETIGEKAFFSCDELASVTLNNGIRSIESGAFQQCLKLKKVIVPRSVENIGECAFGYYEIFSVKVSGFVMCGTKGSAAEKYAQKNGFTFLEDYNGVGIARYSGSSRYATAAAISKAAHPEKISTVVLASGENPADALAAAPLVASYYKSPYTPPILLTKQKSLPKATLDEIKRLGAKNIIIIGGEAAIGPEVVNTLKQNGFADFNITRVKGKNRYGTSVEIAKALKTQTENDPTELFFVMVANDKYADALSVSPVAAKKNAPIIYLPTSGKINDSVTEYLSSLKGIVKNAYVIGGTSAISDEVMKAAGTTLGLTVNKTITRVKGSNKYETCVAVNNTFNSVLPEKTLCLATGCDFPDALAGGVFAAQNDAPLFLVNGKAKELKLSDKQKALLKTKVAEKIFVFGGEGAVPESHVQTVAKAGI